MPIDEVRVKVTLDENPNLNVTLDTKEHLGSTSVTDEDKFQARQLGIPGPEGPEGPIGLPGVVWQGDWNAIQIYNKQDAVKYQGSVYIYINTNASSGHVPTDVIYWDLFVQKGDTGDTGTPGADFALYAQYTSEPTGFANRTDSVLSYNEVSRQFSIAPTSVSYDIMLKGVLFQKTVTDSIIWPDIEGLHYFYFDLNGVIHTDQIFQGIKDNAYIAFIYWDATNKQILHTGEERHGLIMDWKTHEYLHYTQGTKYDRGLAIAYTIGDGSLDSDNTIEISGGVIWDEDLDHVITNGSGANEFEQELSPIARLPVWYRFNENDWRKIAATDYPFAYTQDVGPLYNTLSGVDWVTSQVPSNNYCCYWIVATNDIDNPVVVIMGQHISNTLTKASELNTVNNTDWGIMPTTEAKILYRIILRHRDSYAASTRCYITEVRDLRLTVDKGVLDVNGDVLITVGDKTHNYTQAVASDVWTINHNLEKYPSVTIIDTGGSEVEGELTYVDINTIIITFTAAFTGNAYLN